MRRPADMDGVLLVEDVAAELGVARSTAGEWASRCKLPHFKPAGCRRIFVRRDWLEAWMDGAELETRYLPNGGRVVKPRKVRL